MSWRSWCSRSSGIFELLGQEGFEVLEGITVAGGGGVEGDFEGGGDLGEGEVGPEFEDEDFALGFGELGEGGFDLLLAFGVFEGGEDARWRGRRENILFAAEAGGVGAAEVEGGVTDAGEEEGGGIFCGVAGGPEVEETIVHGVFGLLWVGEILSGEEEERGAVAREPGLPVGEVWGGGERQPVLLFL